MAGTKVPAVTYHAPQTKNWRNIIAQSRGNFVMARR
jgi:hypothetical protein